MAGIEAFFEDVEEETVDLNNPESEAEEEKVEVKPETESAEDSSTETVSSDIEPDAETVETETETEDPTAATIASLRQMLQEQQQKIDRLEGRSQGLTKALTESGTIDEESIESAEPEPISDSRLELLAVLQETMRVNPAYTDLDEVCSQANFDLTVEAIARWKVQEEGGTLTDQIQNVSRQIWALPNPYRYVYDIVKQNHPKYQTPVTPTTARQTPTAPKSISSIPGGTPSHTDGWTAAKIDALSEDELHTVPSAIYDKYMRGDLE